MRSFLQPSASFSSTPSFLCFLFSFFLLLLRPVPCQQAVIYTLVLVIFNIIFSSQQRTYLKFLSASASAISFDLLARPRRMYFILSFYLLPPLFSIENPPPRWTATNDKNIFWICARIFFPSRSLSVRRSNFNFPREFFLYLVFPSRFSNWVTQSLKTRVSHCEKRYFTVCCAYLDGAP